MSDKTKAISLVNKLIEAGNCDEELRALGQQWKSAIGTADEKELSNKLLAALGEDVTPIDAVIAFFESEEAVRMIGAEALEKMIPDFKAARDRGAKYCLCPACTAGLEILEHKELFV